MTLVKIFHNPTAGDGDHSKEILLQQMKEEGYDCSYSSTKKGGIEEPIPEETDIIVLAGGDGTVRKLARNSSRNLFARREHRSDYFPPEQPTTSRNHSASKERTKK